MPRTPEQQAVLSAFGAHLRRLRKRRDWTQEVLAEHAGLSWKYIGAIERGERNVALINLNKISRALGVDFSGFFPCRARVRRRR